MKSIVIFILLFAPAALFAAPELRVLPTEPLQGEAVMIELEGVSRRTPVFLTVGGGQHVPMFRYMRKFVALVPVDLRQATGTVPVELTVRGKKLRGSYRVEERKKIQAPLGIPAKLGGNTSAAASTLINTLAAENAVLAAVPTATRSLWTKPFRLPLENVVVTDGYGYSRSTVGYSIAHKGTDFRAPAGTPVFAMNRGTVVLARTFRNYGNTVVVDHGLGLQTLYMHLSEFGVAEGERVRQGQVIGRSGSTGYAESPHLHLSVRIRGVSVDPMKFMEFF